MLADTRRASSPPRAWLYVPGDRPDRFAKAIAASRGVILDLEDAVPPARKKEARENVADFLNRDQSSPTLVAVRVNPLSALDGLHDLSALLQSVALPDALLIPKIEDAASLRMMDQLLAAAGAATELFALIESPRGVGEAAVIAASTPRLTTLMFGAADYAAALGRETGELDTAYAEAAIVNAATSAGLLAIDSPVFALEDEAALEGACGGARRRGFHGKAAIHPRQVDTIERAFAPTAGELERARRIVATGDGAAATVNGQMVDVAMLRWARRLAP